MSRHRNTDVNGRQFSAAVVQAVWEKAETSATHRPLRLDAFGKLIWREAFGNVNSKLGWEIHHRLPVEQGGGDDLDNLQPVQWENHRNLDAAIANSGAHELPQNGSTARPALDPPPANRLNGARPTLIQAGPAA